jgi:hypothetical protein
MTIVKCPHGCGGTINTGTDNYCSFCRRDLASVEVVIPEDGDTHAFGIDPMTARKSSWCWEWFGPAYHRMRCRLPKGHSPLDKHDTHEEPLEDSIIINTEGDLIVGLKP